MRIQLHVAIIIYCLIAIIGHDLKSNRPVVEIMRILGYSLLTKDSLQDLIEPIKKRVIESNDGQILLDFDFC